MIVPAVLPALFVGTLFVTAIAPLQVHAFPVMETFDSGTDGHRVAICGPVLTKAAGLFELAKKSAAEGSPSAPKLQKAAFQTHYRALVLEKMASKSDAAYHARAWQASADDKTWHTEAGRRAMGQRCYELYRRLDESGQIDKLLEAAAVKEANQSVRQSP